MEFHSDNNNASDLSNGTTLWTMAFSTIGGVYKAQATPHLILESLTVNGSLSVIAYAFMSALVGYCTKKVLDFLSAKMEKD